MTKKKTLNQRFKRLQDDGVAFEVPAVEVIGAGGNVELHKQSSETLLKFIERCLKAGELVNGPAVDEAAEDDDGSF